MTMKKNYIHHTTCAIVLLGAMVAGLWSCQTDYLAEQNNKLQGELKITVIDNGYTTGQALNYEGGTFRELPQTRATENGYKTIFTAGDKIGLYAVKSGALAATNVCLTLTNVGGTLQWKPDAGVKIPADADRYFAYYPYQPSPSGTLNNSATTADEFFSNTIANWITNLDTDQSSTYPSKDLMVGMGTLGATPVNGFYPLDITLTHKMGLAVIKLPASATDITFNGFTPYAGVSGEYRYLLNPAKSTTLSCNFKDGGEVRGFAIAPTIAGGNYKTYTVQ